MPMGVRTHMPLLMWMMLSGSASSAFQTMMPDPSTTRKYSLNSG